MIAIRRILLPTDFSTESTAAVQPACGLIDRFGAELHVLHVIEDPAASLPEPFLERVESLAEHRDATELHALERISELLDADWRRDHHVVRATREGAASAEIVRYARENEIDLIVMATHGRSGLAHALLGSVAEQVVRTSASPVLTIRPVSHRFVPP